MVQIQLPQPKWFRGVAVITSACHAEDREFDSRRDRHYFFGSIAQSVEHRTENPGVGGSIPPGATIGKFSWLASFYSIIDINEKK